MHEASCGKELKGKASGHFEQLNKQMTGHMEDLQGKMSSWKMGFGTASGPHFHHLSKTKTIENVL